MRDVDAYIQAVAEQNRTILAKNDPVLVLHTILRKFSDDLREDQLARLEEFSSTLELEMSKWDRESKERTGRIIAQVVERARGLADEQYQEKRQNFVQEINAALAGKLEAVTKAETMNWRMAVANMITACLLSLAVLLLWLTYGS